MKRADGEGCFNYVQAKDLWRYIVSFPEGRKTFYAKTRKECINKYELYKTERETSGIIVNTKTPLSVYYEHYLKKFQITGSSTTSRMYLDLRTTMLKPPYRLFDIPMGKITTEDITLYFEALQGLIAYSTAKRIKSVLKQVFELAVREKIYTQNPVRNITLKEKHFKETRSRTFLNENEIKVFTNYINSLKQDPLDLMLIFIIHTGLRVGELLGLRWCDVKDDYLYITNNRVRQGLSYVNKSPKSKASISGFNINSECRYPSYIFGL